MVLEALAKVSKAFYGVDNPNSRQQHDFAAKDQEEVIGPEQDGYHVRVEERGELAENDPTESQQSHLPYHGN